MHADRNRAAAGAASPRTYRAGQDVPPTVPYFHAIVGHDPYHGHACREKPIRTRVGDNDSRNAVDHLGENRKAFHVRYGQPAQMIADYPPVLRVSGSVRRSTAGFGHHLPGRQSEIAFAQALGQ